MTNLKENTSNSSFNNHDHSPADTRQGIILIVLGLSIASLAGGFMKILVADLSAIQITWIRFFGYALIMLPIVMIRFGRQALKPARPGIQVIRGISMAAATVAFITGVQTVDFADAIAILYAYPFLLVLLAVLFLGERVHTAGWIGIVGGFIGVLLVMRPEFKSLNSGTLWVFFSRYRHQYSNGSQPQTRHPVAPFGYIAMGGSDSIYRIIIFSALSLAADQHR